MAWDSLAATRRASILRSLNLAFVFRCSATAPSGPVPVQPVLPTAARRGPHAHSAVLSGLLLTWRLFALAAIQTDHRRNSHVLRAGPMMVTIRPHHSSLLFAGFHARYTQAPRQSIAVRVFLSIEHMGNHTHSLSALGGRWRASLD